jgi:hypothetical protein
MITRPINMRLPQNILDGISLIQEKISASNRTQAVIYSVRITKLLIKSLSKGDKIFLEKADGKKERLLIDPFDY